MSPHHQSVGTDDLRKATVIQILIDCCLDQLIQKAHCMQSSLSLSTQIQMCILRVF